MKLIFTLLLVLMLSASILCAQNIVRENDYSIEFLNLEELAKRIESGDYEVESITLQQQEPKKERSLFFGGVINFDFTITDSEDKLSNKFGGDGYSVNIIFRKTFEKSAISLELDTDKNDFNSDKNNSDNIIMAKITHTPNEFMQAQLASSIRITNAEATSSNQDPNNDAKEGIIYELEDSDETYFRVSPLSLISLWFYPMNASTTIGQEFTSVSTQGGLRRQNYNKQYNNVPGMAIEIFPKGKFNLFLLANSKTLKDVNNEEYISYGTKGQLKMKSKWAETILAINHNIQDDKTSQSEAETTTSYNIKGKLKLLSFILTTEYMSTKLNKALRADKTGTGLFARLELELFKKSLKKKNILPSVYTSYTKYDEYLLYDNEDSGNYNKRFIGSGEAESVIKGGFNILWHNFTFNPEYSMSSCESKTYTDSEGRPTDKRSSAKIKFGYSF